MAGDFRLAARALGGDDGAEIGKGAIEVLVDQDVIIFLPVADLFQGVGEPLADGLGIVLGAARETPAQLIDRRRQDENADHVRPRLSVKLQGALPVDIEQHVGSRFQRALDRSLRRAVIIAVHLRPFHELAGFAHRAEPLRIDEVIVHALDFARPARPRRRGDRKPHARHALEQEARQRGLAGARGRREHEHQSAALRRRFATL